MNDLYKVTLEGENKSYYIEIKNDKDINNSLINRLVIISYNGILYIGKIVSLLKQIDKKHMETQIAKFERLASDKDIKTMKKNEKDASKSLESSRKISKELNLDIRILSANYSFDRSHLVFNFISDNRVDFRELAKQLASIYKTRIELHQIGVRDKAKDFGGIGPCGRILCCSLFLSDFESVSINMAKNQFISLKPDKINGVCGRLLCCLNYEDEVYKELKKKFPKVNSKISYNGEEYKVVSINILQDTLLIENKDKTITSISLEDYESKK